ncbi:MAG: hypothetical protein Q8K36_00440, partial [Alphaproteobacteria bacterium]|nr:hypothetical protein [Alphaproteobacteria bacterium]
MNILIVLILCLLVTQDQVLGKICPKSNYAKGHRTDLIKIDAKELSYDSLNTVYRAAGQVHVEQPLSPTQSRNLYADELVYNQSQHQVTATGHVILKDESGNISYADHMVITDDFKDGLIHSLKLMTADQERILSTKATRKDGNVTHFFTASYTPCQVCEKDDAFWQINADEVIHDKDEQKIYYHNATLSFYGIPVFYTPYFSHPDPSVKRKSGLLFPNPGTTTKTGLYVSQPYYYVIDDTSDLTLTPTFMAKENPSAMAQYRKNVVDGRFELSGSYHRQKHSPINQQRPLHPVNEPNRITPNRWHLFSNMDYHIDDHQRLNFKVNRASDTTYLSLYPFNERAYSTTFKANRNLTSHLVYENLHEHTLFSAKSTVYQTDLPKTTPLVIPHVNYDHFSKETVWGGHYHLHGNVRGLKRTW